MYRVGRSPDPFEPPSWRYAQADGTFGNRFDDPGGRRGIVPGDRFRMLYLATTSAAAFGETLARYRPDLVALAGAALPQIHSTRPLVPLSWRVARRLGTMVLHRNLDFADLLAPETFTELRRVLAPVAVALGLSDIDASTLSGPHRLLTQEAARYIYEQHAAHGTALYAGIRYISRLNPQGECWAGFTDRLRHTVLRVEFIPANHLELYDAARVLGLTIEDVGGRRITP